MPAHLRPCGGEYLKGPAGPRAWPGRPCADLRTARACRGHARRRAGTWPPRTRRAPPQPALQRGTRGFSCATCAIAAARACACTRLEAVLGALRHAVRLTRPQHSLAAARLEQDAAAQHVAADLVVTARAESGVEAEGGARLQCRAPAGSRSACGPTALLPPAHPPRVGRVAVPRRQLELAHADVLGGGQVPLAVQVARRTESACGPAGDALRRSAGNRDGRRVCKTCLESIFMKLVSWSGRFIADDILAVVSELLTGMLCGHADLARAGR